MSIYYLRVKVFLYTETFNIICCLSPKNFAGFFGKREIIVMLFILICIAQRFALVFLKVNVSGGGRECR